MGNDDLVFSDDHVAEILAREAQDASLKYSALGMGAYRQNQKPANMPKPNTRFLRNIIKDTNNHNAALLAKEAAESQARLGQLEEDEARKRRKYRPEPQDIRRRQMGSITAILGGRVPAGAAKRDRNEPTAASERRHHRASSQTASPEDNQPRKKEHELYSDAIVSPRSRSHRSGVNLPSDDLFSTKRKSRPGDEDITSSRKRRRGSSGRRDTSPEPSLRRERSNAKLEDSLQDRSFGPKRRRRDSSDERGSRGGGRSGHSDSRRRSRTPNHKERKYRRRSPSQDRERDRRRDKRSHVSKSRHSSNLEEEDTGRNSDPLEDLIGPIPAPEQPIRARGRGAVSSASGIDRRFSESYDPNDDAEVVEESSNWDQAVEAFRDRQKWKQHQEERLKAAGFSEDQLKKWKTGGQQNEEDVRWNKAGEGREWDRGKVL